MAHEFGIKLGDYGVSEEAQAEVRSLRASGASLAAIREHGESEASRPARSAQSGPREASANQVRPPTPAAIYSSRNFHSHLPPRVRRLFTSGHFAEAVAAAMRSVNNRVKAMSGLSLDGKGLMNAAFSQQSPVLQLNALSTTTEQNEQEGLRFLLAGAMSALRNPPVHEDEWQHDRDASVTLECLGFASLLHRLLDQCEQYTAMVGTV
ncbi:MAG: TIGR02391 family protein [Dehalococcoidia bacterium]